MASPFNRFRLFHWLLAGLFLAAYLTGDHAELFHVWLGYGLLAVLLTRLVTLPFKPRGFPKPVPPSGVWRKPDLSGVGKWLTFLTLIGSALTLVLGLCLVDNGEVLAAVIPGVSEKLFGGIGDSALMRWLGEQDDAHEFFAELVITLVGLHIAYILLFRRRSVIPMLRGVAPKGSLIVQRD